MGLFKDCMKGINYIITLGGAEEVEEAKKLYDSSYIIYKELFEKRIKYNILIDEHLTLIGNSILRGKIILDKVQILLESNFNIVNSINIPNRAVEDISSFNYSYNNALIAGFGGVVGGAAAVGSWALVSVLGSASTGTAIISLSGVAATNATLAWFGGGALAVGGAGISGGVMVLGSIVALPMIYFAAKKSYAKAEKIKESYEQLIIEIKQLEAEQPKIKEYFKIVNQHQKEIKKISNQYIENIRIRLDIVYPLGGMSKLKHNICIFFNRNPYSDEQLIMIKEINTFTIKFLDLFSARTDENNKKKQKIFYG